MSDKTFIEIWYETDEYRENWFATRSIVQWKDGSSPSDLNSWSVNGTNLHVYEKSDIQALRLLLDEIEKEFDGEE